MLHARKDYNRFQDPENKIPEDEPVFLLRAQDVLAAATVRYWARNIRMRGANDDIVEAALNHADLMDKWPTKKMPDM